MDKKKNFTIMKKIKLSFDVYEKLKDSFINIVHCDPSGKYDKIKPYQQFKAVVSNPRTLERNGEYWLLLNALSFHFEQYENADDWHMFFKYQYLPLSEFTDIKTGKIYHYPSSTAFDRMDETEFLNYCDKVFKWVLDQGYDYKELLATTPKGNINY